MSNLKFVSYNGGYPNLCSGQLIMNLDGKDIKFPPYCMQSGGSVWFDGDWDEHVEDGPWTLSEFPKDFPKELERYAEDLVNTYVPTGCCGGCV